MGDLRALLPRKWQDKVQPPSNLGISVLKGKSRKEPVLLIVLRFWMGVSMEQSFVKTKGYLLSVALELFGSLPLTEEST